MTSTEHLVIRMGDEDIATAVTSTPVIDTPIVTPIKAPTPGGTAPYGDNPEEVPAVRGKRLLRRSIVFTHANFPKALEDKHLIAEDLESLEMVVTETGAKKKSTTSSKVVAVIRGLRGTVQAFFYKNECDLLPRSFKVYVDAGHCYPVLAHQLYSVEFYSDDAQFEILFFAKKTTTPKATSRGVSRVKALGKRSDDRTKSRVSSKRSWKRKI